MTDYTEQNNLQIITENCDSFCLSSARELSITRDVGERLVFAQMSEITYENVAEYYARLAVLDYAYRSSLLIGTIFDADGNQLDDRPLKVVDFITRIGLTTNLKKDTLRNFLDRAVARLHELEERSIVNYSYTYNELYDEYERARIYFLDTCDLTSIEYIYEFIITPVGLARAMQVAENDAKDSEAKNVL